MKSICKGSTKNFLPSPTCPSAHSAQEWVRQMRLRFPRRAYWEKHVDQHFNPGCSYQVLKSAGLFSRESSPLSI